MFPKVDHKAKLYSGMELTFRWENSGSSVITTRLKANTNQLAKDIVNANKQLTIVSEW